MIINGVLAQLVEHTPDKGEVSGSNPEYPNGNIAQLVEHCFCTAIVSGSIPLISTIKSIFDLIV